MKKAKKAQNKGMQALQKQQIQLVQIEKILESLLGDIKESINEMKVEELQLKSSLVEHFTNPQNQENERPTTSAQAVGATDMLASTGSTLMWLNEQQPIVVQQPTIDLPEENINKQLLDLDTFLEPMQKFIYSDDEEEEEDEDDVEEEEDCDMEFLLEG